MLRDWMRQGKNRKSVACAKGSKEAVKMESKSVCIPNVTCGHCVGNIRRELREIQGVTSVEGDPATQEVTIRWRAPATWKVIAETLADRGYPVKS